MADREDVLRRAGDDARARRDPADQAFQLDDEGVDPSAHLAELVARALIHALREIALARRDASEHANRGFERPGDRLGGAIRDPGTQHNGQNRHGGADCRADGQRGRRRRARVFMRLSNGRVRLVERRHRRHHPHVRILLRVEHLEVGRRGVAAVHALPFSDQRRRELVHPVPFGRLHAEEDVAYWIVMRSRPAAVEQRRQRARFPDHPVVLTAVAGEQIILQRQADLHGLQLDRFQDLHVLEDGRGLVAGRSPADHCRRVRDEQQQQDHHDRAEAQIQFLADGHSVLSA